MTRRFGLRRWLTRLTVLGVACIILLSGLVWWMLNAEIIAGENGMVFIPRNTAVVNAVDSVNRQCPMPWPWVVKTAARIAMRLRPLHIHSGWYVFQKGDTQLDVLEALFTGHRRPMVTVTIPEGFTKWETTARVAKMLDIDSTVLLRYADSLEGKLFPNTYQFFWREEPSDVITRLTGEFAKQTRGMTVSDSVLILASIVQAEAGAEAEMPKIAGVYVNRLQRTMNLEADPTVQYGIRSRKRVLFQHLKVDHDWNTYLRKGLPPTPICSPGMAAINAAIHPDSHGFLFFVAKGDGSGLHRFATTYGEHVMNVQRYRSARRAAARNTNLHH